MIEGLCSIAYRATFVVILVTWIGLAGGCGDQVVIEGVDATDGAVVGDAVIDDPPAGVGYEEGEEYAPGNPYQEAIEGDKNMGPNSPGYIPETIE